MSTLIMMYVFYDKNGDIKAITPALDENFSVIFSSAIFPLSEVESFLTGKQSTFDYRIKKVDKLSGTKYTLVKKYAAISYTRTLDFYLTEVGPAKEGDNTILIVNDTTNKVVSVQLAKEFKELYEHGSEEEQEGISDFLNGAPSVVYITKKKNPYNLLFSFTFTPKALFDSGKLFFNYTGVYNDVSIYTKKLISGYGYKEKV